MRSGHGSLFNSSGEVHGSESLGKEGRIVRKSRNRVLAMESLLVRKMSWSFVRK